MEEILKNSDILVVIGVVSIVVMMVVPIPTPLLDLLLALNLTIAMIVLMLAMYTPRALEFSVFPSLLLVVTLFRLGLNVSSTRLILLLGRQFEGKIIKAFGEFVVGGNMVVGFVIFLILVVIQFIVITKGSARVAEVAARFTLDAMPGKQMAIDADLNSGLISDQEARERRKDIQREADFYGAMDGASKFVQGDAIAGIVITLINLVGGLIIGVLQHQMSIAESLGIYGLYTVGDGLVAQIPALLIATATGIIVTRSASEANLGTEMFTQLLNEPKVLYIAGGLLGFMAMVPSLPKMPFLVLGSGAGGLGYLLSRVSREEQEKPAIQPPAEAAAKAAEEARKPESVASLLHVDPMEIEIGYSLIPLVDPRQGGDLLDRVTMIRRQCALELGLVVPPIRIRDNMQLKPNAYSIKIRGVEVARNEVLVESYLAMNPGNVTDKLAGRETVEPAFGLPATWITEDQRERAESAGYTVVDPPSVVATHLSEVIKRDASQILGREEVKTILETVKQTNPTVVEELIPGIMTAGDLQDILQNLLDEGVSIRNMATILETLAKYGRITKDVEVLTEYVRQALSRTICRQHRSSEGFIPVITLSPRLEEMIGESIQRTETGGFAALDPGVTQRIFQSLNKESKKVTEMGYQGIVLCSPKIRIYFKKLTSRVSPNLVVLSYSEIAPDIEIHRVGTIAV